MARLVLAGHQPNSGLSASGSSVSNLNLISTSNEAKVGHEKPEVRQQIPVKLSSKLSVSSHGGSTKDKSKKSVAGLGKVSLKGAKGACIFACNTCANC